MRRRPIRQVASAEQNLAQLESQLMTVAARLGGMDGRILAQAIKHVGTARTHVQACRVRLAGGVLETPAGEFVALIRPRRMR